MAFETRSSFKKANDPEGTGSAARAQTVRPWYMPDASLDENITACRGHRDGEFAMGRGHYDGEGRWRDYPKMRPEADRWGEV